MTILATVLRAGTEDFYYYAQPDIATDEVIGVSVLKETLVPGEKVYVIQIGTNALGPEYGFCKSSSEVLRTLLEIPEDSFSQVANKNPGQFLCAYMGRKLNRLFEMYVRATVLAVNASTLQVQYLDGVNTGLTATLGIVGIAASEFQVDEVVLVDVWQFGPDMVVGWWEIIGEIFFLLTITIVGEGSVNVNGVVYTAPVELEKDSTASLLAIAGEGYEFDSWSGDTTLPSILMDGNKSVTATFIEVFYTYTFIALYIVGSSSIFTITVTETELSVGSSYTPFTPGLTLPMYMRVVTSRRYVDTDWAVISDQTYENQTEINVSVPIELGERDYAGGKIFWQYKQEYTLIDPGAGVPNYSPEYGRTEWPGFMSEVSGGVPLDTITAGIDPALGVESGTWTTTFRCWNFDASSWVDSESSVAAIPIILPAKNENWYYEMHPV